MKLNYLSYEASITCACSAQEGFDRIVRMVHRSRYLKTVLMERNTCVVETLDDSGSWIGYNSFVPITHIVVNDVAASDECRVRILFTLRKSVKGIICVICLFALLLQLALFILLMMDRLVDLRFACMPLCLLMICILFASVGLRMTAKDMLYIIREALNDVALDSKG